MAPNWRPEPGRSLRLVLMDGDRSGRNQKPERSGEILIAPKCFRSLTLRVVGLYQRRQDKWLAVACQLWDELTYSPEATDEPAVGARLDCLSRHTFERERGRIKPGKSQAAIRTLARSLAFLQASRNPICTPFRMPFWFR